MARARDMQRTTATPYRGRGPGGVLTEQDARELLAEHAHSGLTFQEFTLSKGLVPQRLQWWKSKLTRPAAPPVPMASFVPVAVPGAAPTAPPPPAGPAAGFVVAFSGGRTLHVPPDFDPAALARLLRVLTETL